MVVNCIYKNQEKVNQGLGDRTRDSGQMVDAIVGLLFHILHTDNNKVRTKYLCENVEGVSTPEAFPLSRLHSCNIDACRPICPELLAS